VAPKDLVALVADKNIDHGVRGLLGTPRARSRSATGIPRRAISGGRDARSPCAGRCSSGSCCPTRARLLPKLRSGERLVVSVGFDVEVDAVSAAHVLADIRQILADLGLGDQITVGNHRKYETHDVRKKGSMADVVESYAGWVRAVGRDRQAAIFDAAVDSTSPQAAFDRLYRSIRVRRFDWLCLVGNLRLYAITPGRCYLKGATGPLNGARRFFCRRGAAYPVERLEQSAIELARALRVPMEAIEDALCNWQKRRRQASGGRVTACRAGVE